MSKKIKIGVSIVGIIVLLMGIIGILLYKEQKIPVLCYHNIGTKEEKQNFPEEGSWVIDVNNFEEQLAYLKKHGYKTVSLDEFYQWKQQNLKLPRKSVVITFDDGFLSNYHYAFPLLKKYDMKATVFVIGNYIKERKEPVSWNGDLKQYMTRELLQRAKEEYPNIEFASHSYGLHENGILKEKSKQELAIDVNRFKKETMNTNYYCYPFGAVNEDMIHALKENGYRMAFIYGPTKKEYRKASKKDNDYLIPRLNMSYGMKIPRFAIRLMMPF